MMNQRTIFGRGGAAAAVVALGARRGSAASARVQVRVAI